MKWILLILVIFLIFNIGQLLDVLAHISRYRSHIRRYPATKEDRGRVWSFTK